ncbi:MULTISPECIES: outer membrane protein [Mesorhizobium]|uniref:outer membrane protein n=1 Tax=Mesorhizobium TaxID=68287 RepID=UPI0010A94E59|nr:MULTISPECIES: outer membrane protein [Mesorhizobium]
MKRILLTSAFLLAIAGNGFAADAIAPEAVPAGFVWTGGYVGLQAGYGWGKSDATYSDGDTTSPKVDGFIGGVYVGYNYQLSNNVVVGLDADVTYSDMKGGASYFTDAGDPFDPEFQSDVNLKWSGAVRARLGYAVDRFLPYIAGGVAVGSIEYKGFDNGTVFDSGGTSTHVGWTLGLGTEYAFSDQWVGRAEYRYTDFGSKELSASEIDVKLHSHDLRIGMAYKF